MIDSMAAEVQTRGMTRPLAHFLCGKEVIQCYSLELSS